MNRKFIYILAGAAMIAGGVALLARIESNREHGSDPIEEAQRMLSRARTKISEIEAGLRAARTPQPA